MKDRYDVIVIGAGHAGCEAALASSRMGLNTLVLTMDKSTVAQMSCNPAIGGLAKGQLVREIDALGGEMAHATDATGIQFRMLNLSKGPAVQSPRAQCDKSEYSQYMLKVLETQSNLTLKEDTIDNVLTKNNKVTGVKGQKHKYLSSAIILTTGTFMKGLIHIGKEKFKGGRIDEDSAENISKNLRKLGLETGRLKTGTPPRLDSRTIDFTKLVKQSGDKQPKPFSHLTKKITHSQIPCYITHTNEKTHKIINDNLNRAPLYTGQIKATGPRYCPSIEDKVVRFAQQPKHQIFLEPEGKKSNWIYCNGISTSIPKDAQRKMVRSIRGLEKAKFLKYGYAIEYDFFMPHQIKPTLETKKIENLYLAGQVNSTSGYEEAAAQGIIAGINAALKLRGKEPFILGRDQAYIGVLIDDLITLGPTEPYRMFTSRAEYRLMLRSDNADRRLMKYGYKFGLISKKHKEKLDKKEDDIKKASSFISKNYHKNKTLKQVLKNPKVTYRKLEKMHPKLKKLNISNEAKKQVEIESKYEGYLKRQLAQIERAKKMENFILGDNVDYKKIKHLSKESRGKLDKFKPLSLGQASRIVGVTPADISVLMVYIKARHG